MSTRQINKISHYSNLRVDGRCHQKNYGDHEVIGMVSELLFKVSETKKRDIDYLEGCLREAHLHEQLQLFFSEDRDLVGFVAWALLSTQTEMRILKSGKTELHPSEWNEGNSLWLIDIVAFPGRFKYIARVLRDEIFAPYERVRFARTRGNRTSIHEVTLRKSIGNDHGRSARLCRCGLNISECAMIK